MGRRSLAEKFPWLFINSLPQGELIKDLGCWDVRRKIDGIGTLNGVRVALCGKVMFGMLNCLDVVEAWRD